MYLRIQPKPALNQRFYAIPALLTIELSGMIESLAKDTSVTESDLAHDVCDIDGNIAPKALAALIIVSTFAKQPMLIRIHGVLEARAALWQIQHLLANSGICVETDDALSLIRVYPGTYQAQAYQPMGDEETILPFIALRALHAGHYDIAHVLLSDGFLTGDLLSPYQMMGLDFQYDVKNREISIANPHAMILGHYQFQATHNLPFVSTLIAVSACIRGHVRITHLNRLNKASQNTLMCLFTVLQQLGVRITITKRAEGMDSLDMIGAASYQGGLVFDGIDEPWVLQALLLVSTRCKQANYVAGRYLTESAYAWHITGMETAGVVCDWVPCVEQLQPYWLAV